jgi:ketosteroid isomerase-like protein
MKADSGSVEARMQRLEDLDAIRRLRMEYHRYVNTRRMREAAILYTDDAFVDFGPTEQARGRDEIEALYAKYNQQLDIIKQFPANHMIELNGDEASAEAYADARYGFDGHSVMACASYDEKYRRTAEGWKISEMVVKIHFAVPVQQGWASGGPNYAAWDRKTPIPAAEG